MNCSRKHCFYKHNFKNKFFPFTWIIWSLDSFRLEFLYNLTLELNQAVKIAVYVKTIKIALKQAVELYWCIILNYGSVPLN